MDEFRVIHKEHDGTVRDEIAPMNLDFTLRRGKLGPHDISYDVALANPNMKWGYVGPMRTEWELWLDNLKLMGGLHAPYRSPKGSNVVSITGKSYLWYLQGRHYPFDPLNSNAFLAGTAANNQGIAYQAKKDVAFIIDDLITTVTSRPRSMPIYYSPEATGIVQGMRIELADTEVIYDKINTMSEISPGFDFDVDGDKRLFLYAPHKYLEGAERDPSQCIHVFDKWIVPTDITDAEFGNDGPDYTHLLGLGAGTSTRLGVALSYPQSEDIFYRWDGVEDFSDVTNRANLTDLAQQSLSRALYPKYSMPMSVNPMNIRDFWTTFEPGQAIWAREDFEAQNVDQAWIINEINCRATSTGEQQVSLTLERLDPYGKPGIPNA